MTTAKPYFVPLPVSDVWLYFSTCVYHFGLVQLISGTSDVRKKCTSLSTWKKNLRAPRYDSELPYSRVFRGGKTERILLDPIRLLDRSGDCSPGDTASEPEVQGYGRPGSGPSGRVRDLSAWGIAPSEKCTQTHSDPELHAMSAILPLTP